MKTSIKFSLLGVLVGVVVMVVVGLVIVFMPRPSLDKQVVKQLGKCGYHVTPLDNNMYEIITTHDNKIIFECKKIEKWGDDNFENEARSIRYTFFEELIDNWGELLTAEELSRMVDVSLKSVYSHMDDLKKIGLVIIVYEQGSRKFKLSEDDGRAVALALMGLTEFLRKLNENIINNKLSIRKAGKKLRTHDLSNCILYATGYPCPMCLSAIIWSNIKKVYYGCTPKDAEAIGFRDDFIYRFINNNCSEKETLDIIALNRDDCLKLFEEYSKNNKEIY